MNEFERVRARPASYDQSKPALLFGSSPGRCEQARTALTASGVRLAGELRLEDAPARLHEQASLGLAWLELGTGDVSDALDRALVLLNDMAAIRGTMVIAAVPMELVDLTSARLTDRSTEVLVEPSELDRLASLAVASSGIRDVTSVHDVGKDDASRLRQLSDEIARIASTLARLSSGPDSSALKPTEGDDAPPVDVKTIRTVLRARRLRSRYFSDELFADPAWDMLLELLQAEAAQTRVPVSSLCIGAAVPATTALRWIKTMTEQGLFLRRPDPHDGRRMFIELAPAASLAMRRYFAQLGKLVAI